MAAGAGCLGASATQPQLLLQRFLPAVLEAVRAAWLPSVGAELTRQLPAFQLLQRCFLAMGQGTVESTRRSGKGAGCAGCKTQRTRICTTLNCSCSRAMSTAFLPYASSMAGSAPCDHTTATKAAHVKRIGGLG